MKFTNEQSVAVDLPTLGVFGLGPGESVEIPDEPKARNPRTKSKASKADTTPEES